MKGRAISYSAAELTWLEAHRDMIISDYARAFREAFGREDVELKHLHALRKRKRWLIGRPRSRPKGHSLRFSAAELAWLEANATMIIGDYARAFRATFARDDVEARHLNGLRKRRGWQTGRTGQFEKGQASPNKGKRCPEGVSGRHPNARATQFKKGTRTGRANENYQPIGTERLRPDGYVQRKIHDGLPFQSRWRFVHLIEWEAVNGPIPKGHVLKCLSDNRQNCDPTNWELIPHGLLPLLNGGPRKKRLAFDQAEPELKPTIMAIAKLEHASHLRRKAAR